MMIYFDSMATTFSNKFIENRNVEYNNIEEKGSKYINPPSETFQ